jgi:H+/Cl- antiporter ClcA
MNFRHWIKRIRAKGKFLLDLVTSEQIRTGFLQALPFWIASLAVGIIAVIYAWLFVKAENLLLQTFQQSKWIVFILSPVCFVMAWWVVKQYAPNARGSGIPQVMAAIELSTPKKQGMVSRLLGIRIIAVKIVSSLFMVLGGGAIGREGPTIQIAGSVFHIVNKYIPETWPKLARQSYILTGAAAGLAAAFNTPLGGMVFAMEELSKIHIRFFRTALFAAVIIAGLTAQGLLGPYLYLGYPDVGQLSFSVFFAVAVTAVMAGLGGGFMSRLIIIALRLRSRLKRSSSIILFLIILGLTVAFVATFINPAIMGSGKDLMTSHLFTENKDVSWDTVLLRIIAPVMSFSTGAAGGVFAPSLAAGAGIGAFIAGIFDVIGSNANILILAGMVGFLTGITRTPFTSAILVLEMTDRHSVIFHLMLAAMLAYLAALLIDKHSLYDHLKKSYLRDASR